MTLPENIEQALKADLFRIVLNPNNLVMSRRLRTDILVARIIDESMAIPNLRLRHAWNPLVRQFRSPEATGAELRELLTWRRNIVVGSLRDSGGSRVGLGTRPESEPGEEVVHRRFIDGDGSSGFGERGSGFGSFG